MLTNKISYEELIALNGMKSQEVSEALGRNRSFCHYTSIYNCNSILAGKTIWASLLGNTNDLVESEKFKNNKRVFVLCFCDSKTEKIPLWYMYSGGKSGARIRLTNAKMKKFIESIQTVTAKVKGEVGEERIVEYHRNIDFDVEFGRIYYGASAEKIKYRNDFHTLESKTDFNRIQTSYWFKNYEWEYEKEFRIVLIFNFDVESTHVEIPLAHESITDIMLSPECERDIDTLGDGFKAYLMSKLLSSTLRSKIDIVKKYFEIIPTYISSLRPNSNEQLQENVYNTLLSIRKAINEVLGA